MDIGLSEVLTASEQMLTIRFLIVYMGNPDLDSLGFMQQIAFKVVPPQEQGGE